MVKADIQDLQEAIRKVGLDGWLFSNFHHRDPLSDSLLGLSADAINTRQWVYILPAIGDPKKIVHTIENEILDSLPGEKQIYSSRQELKDILIPFQGLSLAAQYSETLLPMSFLDYGTASFLSSLGISLNSSDPLIQIAAGTLDKEGISSHEKAAHQLYDIVNLVWSRLNTVYHKKESIREGEIQRWILDEFENRGMETDHPPIVAAGAHSGNPHYIPETDKGEYVKKGEVLQLDLWAKYKGNNNIFADISWVGVYDTTAPENVVEVFSHIAEARDHAVEYIASRFMTGQPVSGFEVDKKVRNLLISYNYGPYLKHRTGHGIDTEVHGMGVGLDSVEFPDHRYIREGSCFSIEPGVYMPQFGLRTEIDVYINQGIPVVSGGNRQKHLLFISPT